MPVWRDPRCRSRQQSGRYRTVFSGFHTWCGGALVDCSRTIRFWPHQWPSRYRLIFQCGIVTDIAFATVIEWRSRPGRQSREFVKRHLRRRQRSGEYSRAAIRRTEINFLMETRKTHRVSLCLAFLLTLPLLPPPSLMPLRSASSISVSGQ
jgi:hypothetical protein